MFTAFSLIKNIERSRGHEGINATWDNRGKNKGQAKIFIFPFLYKKKMVQYKVKVFLVIFYGCLCASNFIDT